MFRNLKIRHRIILYYSAVILVCVSTISFFSYYQSSKVIISNTSENVNRILRKSSENIDELLIDIETVVNTYLANQSVYNIIEMGKSSFVVENHNVVNIYDVLTDITLIRPEIESIFVFDKNNKVYGHQRYEQQWPYEVLLEMAEAGKGKLVWLEPQENSKVISVLRLIKNTQLEDIGIVLVNIRKSSIEDQFKWHEESFRSSSMVVDESGNVIVASGTNQNRILEDVSLIESFGENRMDFGDYVEDTPNLRIYGYESGYNNWKYITIIQKEDLLSNVQSIRNGILLWGSIFTMIFLFISYLISYEITMPIRKITKRMKEFEVKGEVTEIRFKHRDEILYLYETFVDMTGRINDLVVQNYEQSVLQKKQQIKILQAQINPHFLYNTLDIINWKARERNVPEIGGMIKALANNLRYSFASNTMDVTLEDEINHIKDYLYLQKYRYSDELSYDFRLEEGIQRYGILQLTLQPIIENCIRHAFREIESNMMIQINCFTKDGDVHIEIIDNGRGMDEKTAKRVLMDKDHVEEKEDSIGLYNVNKRLVLKYGQRYGLRVTSEIDEGTEVTILLPKYEVEQ